MCGAAGIEPVSQSATDERPPTFQEELRALINKHSVENLSNTPDFILAAFLENVLVDWTHATRARDKWFGSEHQAIGGF